MKNPKTIAIVVGALVLLGVGFLFFKSPKPIIEIKAETITDIGPFPLVNTYVTSFCVMVLLIVVAVLATRKATIIPNRLQNLVESVMEAMYNICINTAGEKNGRRFFPVVLDDRALVRWRDADFRVRGVCEQLFVSRRHAGFGRRLHLRMHASGEQKPGQQQCDSPYRHTCPRHALWRGPNRFV